ncbi:MAG: acireductone synthase [Cyanobacteriota bacterium]|jgi:enolase-phosphatase E1
MNASITHVLLDIEGTTCPVQFVSETLFPYAADELGDFLDSHNNDVAVQELLSQVAQAWKEDPNPTAQRLLKTAPLSASLSTQMLPYLQWLIEQDRKLTPLKDLQGMVWEAGYKSGALKGPLYDDVAPALHRWRDAGLGLAVYSSGSVKAQQLIYGHSNVGDLRPLFQHWFDTRIGSKLEPESYIGISADLSTNPQSILFISDSTGELRAARTSGLAVLLCDRNGSHTCQTDCEGFATVQSFDKLDPYNVPKQI